MLHLLVLSQLLNAGGNSRSNGPLQPTCYGMQEQGMECKIDVDFKVVHGLLLYMTPADTLSRRFAGSSLNVPFELRWMP